MFQHGSLQRSPASHRPAGDAPDPFAGLNDGAPLNGQGSTMPASVTSLGINHVNTGNLAAYLPQAPSPPDNSSSPPPVDNSSSGSSSDASGTGTAATPMSNTTKALIAAGVGATVLVLGALVYRARARRNPSCGCGARRNPSGKRKRRAKK